MTVVVDASLALKWVLQEVHTEHGLELWDRWQVDVEWIVAPSIFRAEVANALHQQMRRGYLSRTDSGEILNSLIPLVAIRESTDLYLRALSLASQLGLGSVYDALYLALAVDEGCEIWTADERLVHSVQAQFPQVRGIWETS